jgi:hypothetical protein
MYSHPIPTHYIKPGRPLERLCMPPATPTAMELWSSTLLLLLALLGPIRCSSQGLDVVELTLLAGAADKGAGILIS